MDTFKLASHVPPHLIEGLLATSPDAQAVLEEAQRRLAAAPLVDGEDAEDLLLAIRYVLSGGHQVGLVRLAATGILASRGAFILLADWIGRRKGFLRRVLETPEAVQARKVIASSIPPSRWELGAGSGPSDQAVRQMFTFEWRLLEWYRLNQAAAPEAIAEAIRNSATFAINEYLCKNWRVGPGAPQV